VRFQQTFGIGAAHFKLKVADTVMVSASDFCNDRIACQAWVPASSDAQLLHWASNFYLIV